MDAGRTVRTIAKEAETLLTSTDCWKLPLRIVSLLLKPTLLHTVFALTKPLLTRQKILP